MQTNGHGVNIRDLKDVSLIGVEGPETRFLTSGTTNQYFGTNTLKSWMRGCNAILVKGDSANPHEILSSKGV
jgi:hypothetical protein